MQKFKIPSVPPTTNKCIRFPNDIIEEVEKAIQIIQTLEPTGIGAKDLRECFLLQIDALPEEKKTSDVLILRNIIENHLVAKMQNTI